MASHRRLPDFSGTKFNMSNWWAEWERNGIQRGLDADLVSPMIRMVVTWYLIKCAN